MTPQKKFNLFSYIIFLFVLSISLASCFKSNKEGFSRNFSSLIGSSQPEIHITSTKNNLLIHPGNASSYEIFGTCSPEGKNVEFSLTSYTTPCEDGHFKAILDLSEHVDGDFTLEAYIDSAMDFVELVKDSRKSSLDI